MLDKGFSEAKQLWLDNLNKYKGNTTVIWNAANFFKISDSSFAEKLIKEAALLEPTNPRWPTELGHILMLEMRSAKARNDVISPRGRMNSIRGHTPWRKARKSRPS